MISKIKSLFGKNRDKNDKKVQVTKLVPQSQQHLTSNSSYDNNKNSFVQSQQQLQQSVSNQNFIRDSEVSESRSGEEVKGEDSSQNAYF